MKLGGGCGYDNGALPEMSCGLSVVPGDGLAPGDALLLRADVPDETANADIGLFLVRSMIQSYILDLPPVADAAALLLQLLFLLILNELTLLLGLPD